MNMNLTVGRKEKLYFAYRVSSGDSPLGFNCPAVKFMFIINYYA